MDKAEIIQQLKAMETCRIMDRDILTDLVRDLETSPDLTETHTPLEHAREYIIEEIKAGRMKIELDTGPELKPKQKNPRLELENMTWEYDTETRTWNVRFLGIEPTGRAYLARPAMLLLLRWLIKDCDSGLPIYSPFHTGWACDGNDAWKSDE